MNIKKVGLCLALLLILGAAGCGGPRKTIRLGQAMITTQINADNSPVGEVATILDSTRKIYLSAEVIDARRGDKVGVTWRSVGKDQILATEVFTGRRTSDRSTEFMVGSAPITSWLASTLILNDISWAAGDYEAIIQINAVEVKRMGFAIVTERDYDTAAKQAYVKNIWLGTEINSRDQIVSPATIFSKTDEIIYAVVSLWNVPKGTKFQGTWKLLETNQIINNFATEFTGSGYLPFDISLSEVKRSVWIKGNYTFTIAVDNLPVATKNFTIN